MSETMIRLDPIALRHASAVQRLASDPAVGATSNVPSPYPPDGARSWIESERTKREQGRSYAFAVLDAAGQVVGVATLMGVDRAAGMAGLGYWIGTPYWRLGKRNFDMKPYLDFGIFRNCEKNATFERLMWSSAPWHDPTGRV